MRSLAVLAGVLILTASCVHNHPPGVPLVPAGPAFIFVDSLGTYATTAGDPDFDPVAVRFAWGDGDTSAWLEVLPDSEAGTAHAWNAPGTYEVRAQAQDPGGLMSGWSVARAVKAGALHLSVPPGAPVVPAGPDTCPVLASREFRTSALDPDGDSVCFRFDWGDGDTSNWGWYVPSGSSLAVAHYWDTTGVFAVRAQARDSAGETSPWSGAKIVAILDPGYPFRALSSVPFYTATALWATPDCARLYVYDRGSRATLVLRTDDCSVIDSIPWNFRCIAFNPNGSRMYGMLGEALLALSLPDHRVVDTLLDGRGVDYLACSPSGEYLYAASPREGWVAVIRTSDDVLVDAFTMAAPGTMVFLPDGEYLYIARQSEPYGLNVVRTSDNVVADSILTGLPIQRIVSDASGGRLYGSACSPRGVCVYVVDTGTNALSDSIDIDYPAFGLACLPGEDYLLVLTYSLSVIDTRTGLAATRIPVPDDPVGLALQPDGRRAFVLTQQSLLVLGH